MEITFECPLCEGVVELELYLIEDDTNSTLYSCKHCDCIVDLDIDRENNTVEILGTIR